MSFQIEVSEAIAVARDLPEGPKLLQCPPMAQFLSQAVRLDVADPQADIEKVSPLLSDADLLVSNVRHLRHQTEEADLRVELGRAALPRGTGPVVVLDPTAVLLL